MAAGLFFYKLTFCGVVILLLVGCEESEWNNPYRISEQDEAIIYTSFSERPKELDPVKSYNAAEYEFITQIYEPPLQYHFLKRPYELVPLAAARMPVKIYYDKNGNQLSADVETLEIAYIDYIVEIKQGIRYQPHPAFARDSEGNYLYHALELKNLDGIHVLSDFSKQGSRELTAYDYVYQIKRLAHPNLHSPLAGLLGNYILGFAEYREAVLNELEKHPEQWLDLRNIPMQGLQVLDDYRYRIRLKEVYPQFIYWLSMPFFSPIPWEADKFYSQAGMNERNISFNWYPVGTGPYLLAENNPNLRMVLEKNPNFHGERYPGEGEPEDYRNGMLEDAGKELPFVDRIVFSLEKESIPYWNKFLQGYYDKSGISSDSFDQSVKLSSQGEFGLTEDMQSRGIQLASAVATSLYYIGFNMRDEVVGGLSERARLLRRAISIVVDYDEYIAIFQNGRGVAAQGPIPPGIFGFEEGEFGINPYVFNWRNGRAVRKSINEAKELMRQAGYADGIDQRTGKPLILYFDTVSSGVDSKARLNWMIKQFAKIDIQLVIRATDANRFFGKLDDGAFQIYQLGWNADYPDPENFMFLLYGPNSTVLSKGQNYSNYQSAEFDRLFDEMKSMENGVERLALIREMNEVVRADAPWIFAFNPKAYSLYHSWYRNVKPNLMANNTYKYKRVDPGIRAAQREQWNQPIMWPVYLLIALLVVTVAPAIRSFYQREAGKRSMIAYIIRRALYAIPILIGVNIITFVLFFVVNSPDDVARLHLGQKHITEQQIDDWKRERGYHLPLFINSVEEGSGKFTKTIFFQKSFKLFLFDFGSSDSGRDIGYDISNRMWPSLAISVPSLLVGLAVTISLALLIAFFRATYIDYWAVIICVALMSISALFYIIGGQFLIGKLLRIVPISGYDTGLHAFKFLILPVLIGVIGGLGSGTRWYRTIFLEEIGKDYVRTARSKGISEQLVLFKHVLRNALIPILTGVVVILPTLFIGSLLTESFFGIPGLGSYTIDAINRQDFAIVRSMVFLGSVLYIIGLLLTDISYTLVDPRIRFH